MTPVYPDGGRKRLIQYKYSSVGTEIGPEDLREILCAFRRSVDTAKLDPKDVEFYLTTNRQLNDNAADWFSKITSRDEFKTRLHNGVKKKKNLAKLPFTKLYPIFRNLTHDHRDLDAIKDQIAKVSDRHGMLPNEVKMGVDAVVGHLKGVASSSGDRIVNRQVLLEKLLGRGNPLSLSEDDSITLQQNEVSGFKNRETQGVSTVSRAVMSDIAEAAGVHPFVLVKGAGGCGKSVAVCDSASRAFESLTIAPGFALIVKASELERTSIQTAVARWRQQVENPDQNDFRRSIGRLRLASSVLPTMTIYVDGVDERMGQQGLTAESRELLSNLIDEAIASVQNGVPGLSVVVSCRTQEDLDSILGGGGFALAAKPHPVSVLEFDDDEILNVVRDLGGDTIVKERIESHLRLRRGKIGDQIPSGDAPIAADRMDTIRHPVLWRCFAQLADADQHAFLGGESEAAGKLAARYIDWFYRKVNARIGPLALNAARIALSFSAERFANDSSREATLVDDWIKPCSDAGCPPIHQMPIFEEAISAGLIERRGGQWRWLRPWLCEWIANGEAVND
ncbi:hypothetical protein [Neorhodopirellula lusitana]|uniref:hypothetical protein n=1 Tax=Neorhodopirellula lusitana TaxID=445327 RepID=UPI0038507E7B